MMEYIIPAAALIVVAVIEAVAAHERKLTKQERKAAEEKAAKEKKVAEEHEKAREQMMVLVIQSTRASIALGESTAHALQRGYTNGDTEAALEYAIKIKHEQKDFLAKQGIHAMWE